MPVAATRGLATVAWYCLQRRWRHHDASATMVLLLSKMPVAAPGGSATMVLALSGSLVATPRGSATVVLAISGTPVAAPGNAYCARQQWPTHIQLAHTTLLNWVGTQNHS